MNKNPVERIITTIFCTWMWCAIWILLEYMIYGHCENRLVDNIMTLLVVPIIYKAVKEK